MPECYIRGSTIKYLRIPDEIIDMVREEAAKGRGRGGPQQQKQQKGRGMGGAGRGGVPMRMRWGRDTQALASLHPVQAPCRAWWCGLLWAEEGPFSRVCTTWNLPRAPHALGQDPEEKALAPAQGSWCLALPLLSSAGVFGGRGRGGIPGAGRGQPEKKPGRQAGKQ